MAVADHLETLKHLLSRTQAARYIGCHPATLFRWVQENKVPFIRVRGRVKFDPQQLAQWLRNGGAMPKPKP
jgi:excisionase family DNA binding protein